MLLLSPNYVMASIEVSKSNQKNVQLHEIVRPLAKFPEKVSGARFTSYTLDKQVYDGYAKEIDRLKEEVRNEIVAACSQNIEKLTLIDTVERLGVSYHFEKEIDEQMELVYGENSSEDYFDLATAALRFRLFRQHGFVICSDIFNQFTCENGRKFKSSLRSDIKGLLSLYEATQVRTQNDSILDEALIFTTNNLSSGPRHSSPYIDKLVKYALHPSLDKSNSRLVARHFISAYGHHDSRNESLFRLAKLDYNLLQLLYKEELSTLLRWWKELGVASQLQYTRDRLVECYFFAVAMAFEPHYSDVRILLTKSFAIATVIDDTYDAYGTLDELDVFTEAIERWDISETNQLHGDMKISYDVFLKMNGEVEQYAAEHGRSFAFHHLKEAWKDYARVSNIQAKWFWGNEFPSYEEYMRNGLLAAGVKLSAVACFFGMESASEGVLDWISHDPPVLVAAMKILRYQNDAATYKFEKERGQATAIDFYMKSYNVSEEEAKKKIMEMAEISWKDLREEYYVKPKAPITRDISVRIFNLACLMDMAYRTNQDGWTDTHKSVEPFLDKLLVDPIPL